MYKLFDSKAHPTIWYIPNIIDYTRIGLVALFIMTALSAPLLAFWCYLLAATLDMLDGSLARLLNQVSRLGTVLDFVIDRVCSNVLGIVLILLHPHLWQLIVLAIILDISAHFMQLYSAIFTQHSQSSHKILDDTHQHPLLGFYHQNRFFFCGICCISYETVFLGAYSYHFFPQFWNLCAILISIPGFVMKMYIHILMFQHGLQICAQPEDDPNDAYSFLQQSIISPTVLQDDPHTSQSVAQDASWEPHEMWENPSQIHKK